MRSMRALSAATLLLVCGLVAGLHSGVALSAQTIVLSEGHADAFQPKFENGQLVLYFRDDTASKLGSVNPADVLMVVNPIAETSVPSSPSFSFLGDPGDAVWVMPQDQQGGVLWPGISTESLDGQWQGNQIELRLVSVTAPAGGEVFLYTIRSFSEVNRIWSSNALPGSYNVGVDVHAHMNWAFTQPGQYTLHVQACGTHTGPGNPLGRICSATTPYSIDVRAGQPQPTATPSSAPSTPVPSGTLVPGATAPAATATSASAASAPQGTPRAQGGVRINVGIRPPSTGDAGLATKRNANPVSTS